MKVHLLIDSLAPGGTETSCLLLAAAMEPKGVATKIVTLKSADPDLLDVAFGQGTPVVQVDASSWVGRVRAVRNLLRSERPDVLHTALHVADLVGRFAALGTGVPVLSSFVNTPYVAERLRDPNVARWRLRAHQAFDGVTGRFLVDSFHAVSEGVRDDNATALRLPLDRIHVAERGRDVSSLGTRTNHRRAQVRALLGISDDRPVILNIGRQEYQKGQLDLIKASALISAAGTEHAVLIAGKPGNASVALMEMIDRCAATDSVRLLGHRSDVGDLLAAADILVVSSLFEGTAGAALEAMAMAVPIVSTDLTGTRGILRHGDNALLVPVADADGLARGIQSLLGDPALARRLAEQGHLDFTERYTLERSAEAMASLYRAVLQSGSKQT